MSSAGSRASYPKPRNMSRIVLKRCLRSIAVQVDGGQVELMVVDRRGITRDILIAVLLRRMRRLRWGLAVILAVAIWIRIL